MANVDSIFGARYIGSLSPSGAVKAITCAAVAGDIKATFIGDFVTHQGTSLLISSTDQVVPVVSQSAASDRVFGFVMSVNAERAYENQVYRTASTLRTLQVMVDPYALFEIQTSGTFAIENIGLNANFVVASGSTVTGLSGMELDQTTVADTITLPLKIVGFIPRPDNTIGLNSKLICTFNNSAFHAGSTGF